MGERVADSYPRTLMAAVGAAVAICAVLLAFSWPTLVAEPRDVPVAVTGQPQLVQQLRSTIGGQAEGRIELITVADRGSALDAVTGRDAVGAIVLDLRHPEVIIASAAGTGPTQLMAGISDTLQQKLDTVAAGLPGDQQPQLAVTDVAPYGPDDPQGIRLAVAGLPLTIGGVLGGAMIALALARPGRHLVALGTFALLAGFGLTAILQFWYGALTAGFMINGLAMSLALLAVAGVVIGLRRLLGAPGIGVAAVLFVLLANPISGSTVPSDFLPEPWATLGQWTPQGAGPTLLRNLSFFPDAATLGPWAVLAGWAAAGIILIGLTWRRSRTVSLDSEFRR